MIRRLIFVLGSIGLTFALAWRFPDTLDAWRQKIWAVNKEDLEKLNTLRDFATNIGALLILAVSAVWGWIVYKKPTQTGDAAQEKAQLAEYRRYIKETYQYLDFKGIGSIAEAVKGASGLALESVYVPLRARPDTPDGESWHRLGGRCYRGAQVVDGIDAEQWEREAAQTEAAALPIEQWIHDKPALLILGDPGSGKSTILKRMALELAQREDAPLPILLPLNAYGKELEKRDVSLEAYLPEYYQAERSQLDKEKLQRLFHSALERQNAVVLMDGLDEVGDNRGRVVKRVENFVRAWITPPEAQTQNGNRMVVTSRFVGYRDHPLADPRWHGVALSDWNREEIERFFGAFTLASELAWSGGENRAAAREKAADECRALLQVIDGNAGIRRLAGNPLLASLLALIKRQGVTLPHRRVELYKLYMETLLSSWNRARSLDKQPIGPQIDFTPTQRLLAKLALHLRQTNPQGGLIAEQAMRDYLVAHYEADGYDHHAAVEQARSFLDSVHKYSNLLIEKGYRQYGFIHLTFEEYLAGFGLALERDEDRLYAQLTAYLQKPEHWRETLLLGMGVLAVVNHAQELAQALLGKLLDSQDARQILFAGQVLNDVGAAALGNAIAQRIKRELLSLGQSTRHHIGLRRQAGLLLGDSGWLPEDLEAFIKIPKGKFLQGEEKTSAEIEQDCWIGKYPVTNAQYRRFVEAGGYAKRRYWTDRGWEWREREDWRQPAYWEDSRWNNPPSPVVGVSWFEASAYALWLQERMRAQPAAFGLPATLAASGIVRLPTNEEWERAARGVDGRIYPWGDPFRAGCANCRDSWDEAEGDDQGTSAVCLFAQGVSPEGLWDCAGNVWEWSSSLDKDGDPYVRGGSWFDGSDDVRCAVRYRIHPDDRNNILGFRVLCVEALPG